MTNKPRVAILGTENTHAECFAAMMTDGRVPGLEPVGIYGYDNDANKKLLGMGMPYCADRPDEFVGKVDAVLVTARHGDLHYDYAMPYIKAGIPVFVDKPFCVDRGKAREMALYAKEHGVPLAGGSPLRYIDEIPKYAEMVKKPSASPIGTVLGGTVGSPLKWEEEFGGFVFYSEHLIEIILSVFGENVREIYASREKDRCACIFRYDDFDVTGNYYFSFHYGISLYGTDGIAHASVSPAGVEDSLMRELKDFETMLHTGVMTRDYGRMLYPLDIIYAMMESMETGRWVTAPKRTTI